MSCRAARNRTVRELNNKGAPVADKDGTGRSSSKGLKAFRFTFGSPETFTFYATNQTEATKLARNWGKRRPVGLRTPKQA